MAINLPPPPREDSSPQQWQQWYESLWRKVNPAVAVTNDANDTISNGTTYQAVINLTAPRTLVLPASDDLRDGDEIIVQDESGLAASHNITISRSGTDTVNGGTSVTISANYGRKTVVKRGSAFFAA